jgi:hypothetical protein
MAYLPDSYKVRSGPGVSGVRFQTSRRPKKNTRLRRTAGQIERETPKPLADFHVAANLPGYRAKGGKFPSTASSEIGF